MNPLEERDEMVKRLTRYIQDEINNFQEHVAPIQDIELDCYLGQTINGERYFPVRVQVRL